MSEIKTGIFWVMIGTTAGVITLLVGSNVVLPVDWSLVVAIVAIFVAVYSSFITHRFSKIDRAYSHSIYKSDRYLDALKKLEIMFPGLSDEAANSPPPREIYNTLQEKDNERREINIVLNHWGRFASEYYAGVLDRERALEISEIQFTKVFGFFGEYFRWTNPNTGAPILCPRDYKNTLMLMKEWIPKKERPHQSNNERHPRA